MKNVLTATALAACLVTPAFAQSSVNIYGRLNVSIERISDGDVKTTDLVNNASRIGFKGTEDLGGGLKAGFQLEHGFNANTGAANSTFWGRQAEVNLSGSFGMVRLGTFTSEAYFATADYVSLHNHDTGTSSDWFYFDANGFNGARKLAYRTPAMGGLVAEVAVQEGNNFITNKRGLDLAVNYDLNALHLGGGYSKNGDLSQVGLRALYEAGPFTVGGYFQHADFGNATRNSYRLAGQYNAGATELHANVGWAGDISGNPKSSAYQLTLGVNQNLSKRTKVYAFYTHVGADGAKQVYTNGNFTSVALGVRHNF